MLIVFALCVIVSPLRAQSQGRWVKYYEAQGSTVYDLSPRPPYGNWPVVYDWSNLGWPLPFTPILSYSSNMDFSARTNGKVTAVWQWLDANGNPAPNPPSRVYLKVTAGAGWGLGWGPLGASAPSLFAHSADNGWGAPYRWQFHPGQSATGASWGMYLIQRAPVIQQNGIAEIRVSATLDSQIQGHSSANQYGQVSASAGFTVDQDTRGAVITSTLDPTYHREVQVVKGQPQPLRVLNTPDNIGTMYGDTVAPICSGMDAYTMVDYRVDPFGVWGSDSYYHWYSSLRDVYDEGTWMPTPVEPFSVMYPATNLLGFPVVVPGCVDHIHLRLVDSADGANLTANYYMRFHEVYEDWWEDTSYAQAHQYPRRPVRAYRQDWKWICLLENDSLMEQSQNLTRTVTDSRTETGQIEGTVPSGRVATLFAVKTGISVGITKTVTFSEEDRVTVAPYTTLEVYGAITWCARKGTCTKWGGQGYIADVEWTGISVSPVKSWAYIEYPL